MHKSSSSSIKLPNFAEAAQQDKKIDKKESDSSMMMSDSSMVSSEQDGTSRARSRQDKVKSLSFTIKEAHRPTYVPSQPLFKRSGTMDSAKLNAIRGI